MRVSVLVVLLAAATAHAESYVDRHELPPKIVGIKRQGKVAGFRLTLRLQPVNYDRVRIGLGKLKSAVARTAGTEYDTKLRLLAAGEHEAAGEAKYLRHQFPEITGLTKGQVKEVEFEVLYKDVDLKPGEKVDVISAWFGPTTKMNLAGKQLDYWHVFGMYDGPVQQNDESSTVTLPGEAAEKAPESK